MTRAGEVLFYANRLVHLTEEAKRLEQESPSQLALENEQTMASFAEKLELPDLRNPSQRAQQRQIENAIQTLQDTRHDLRARVDVLRTELEKERGNVAALRGVSDLERERLETLEAERLFNLRFAEVSSTFSPDEAEMNDRISQQRADAVLAYFVNNDTVPAGRISAVGKGFSEPLASDEPRRGAPRIVGSTY